MLKAVGGYYNGNQIVMDEQIPLYYGQRVIITVLEHKQQKKSKIDLKKYAGRGAKMFSEDIDEYVEGLRSNDRI